MRYFYLQIASEDSDGTGCFQVKIDPRDTKNQDLFIYIFGGGFFPLQSTFRRDNTAPQPVVGVVLQLRPCSDALLHIILGLTSTENKVVGWDSTWWRMADKNDINGLRWYLTKIY